MIQVWGGGRRCYAGEFSGNMSVTQGPCGLGRCPGVVCVVLAVSAGVNLEDEGLGQPRQVMTAAV